MRKIFGLLAVVLLFGCAKPVSQMNYAEMRDLAGQIRARCIAQGVRPGTPEWNDCGDVEINHEIQQREQQRAVAQAGLASAGQTFSNLGAQVAARPPLPTYQPPMTAPRQQFNCRTTATPLGSDTTCY